MLVNIGDNWYHDKMYGIRLANERRRLGMSQEQLAPYLGIGRSALAMIETDRAPLDVARVVELAERVGLDPLYVLTGEPSHVVAGKLLDWDIVLAIQQVLHEWCHLRNIVLTPEKQTELLKIFYERYSKFSGDLAKALQDELPLAA